MIKKYGNTMMKVVKFYKYEKVPCMMDTVKNDNVIIQNDEHCEGHRDRHRHKQQGLDLGS